MLLKFINMIFINVIKDVINFSKVNKKVTKAMNFINNFNCVATVICYYI
jgi:hypothetical protein